MALALAGEPLRYVSPGWTRSRRRPLARRALPPELAGGAERLLMPTEAARVGLGRLRRDDLAYPLIWRRNVLVDRRTAPTLAPGSTVVAQYGGALACFTHARATDGLAILDYPIARVAFVQELLREEAELRPELADTIVGPRAPFRDPAHVRRMDEEAQLADAIVVGSRFAAESFATLVPPDRVEVVPYGCDTNRFAPAARELRAGPLRVLFVGQLTQRKGIAYLLDALRLLDPARFELTLAGRVVGAGAWLADAKAPFRHLGDVRPSELPALYRASDVLVLPSLAEGSAVAVLEAMASGLPVVVTANTGVDYVRDGREGFVVPTRSPEAIAERLEHLAADTAARSGMGAAARDAALRRDWSAFRSRFRALVERLEDARVVREAA
jgi:starch synthase